MMRSNLSQNNYIRLKTLRCTNTKPKIQYTRMNLSDVCSAAVTSIPTPCSSTTPCDPCQNNDPVTIDSTATIPFYYTYTIDPLGELFGQTPCGVLNYTKYQTFYP